MNQKLKDVLVGIFYISFYISGIILIIFAFSGSLMAFLLAADTYPQSASSVTNIISMVMWVFRIFIVDIFIFTLLNVLKQIKSKEVKKDVWKKEENTN